MRRSAFRARPVASTGQPGCGHHTPPHHRTSRYGPVRLTPAHHLRGAVRNGDVSDKVGEMSVRSKGVAAPRLVHALVIRRTSTVAVGSPIIAGERAPRGRATGRGKLPAEHETVLSRTGAPDSFPWRVCCQHLANPDMGITPISKRCCGRRVRAYNARASPAWRGEEHNPVRQSELRLAPAQGTARHVGCMR